VQSESFFVTVKTRRYELYLFILRAFDLHAFCTRSGYTHSRSNQDMNE